jgi:DNA polymerase-3 subunit delta
MKIGTREADAFVRAPHKSCVLVYGPDQGLMRERARALAAGVLGADGGDPFRSSELSGAAVAADPARLVDEAAALSLVGGRRVVRVTAAGDGVAEAAGAVLKVRSGHTGDSESLVILEAGELGPRSGLRRLFEESPAGAALACYADDPERLSDLGRAALLEKGHLVEDEALDWLTTVARGDRSVLRQELEKLSLFVGPGARVTAADAEACLGDTTALDLDDAALASVTGDLAALDRVIGRAYAAGQSPVALLRTIGRELLRLHPAAGAVAGGASVDAALSEMRPPVFFRHKPAYQRALGSWGVDDLARAIEVVAEAELACKKGGGSDESVAWRAALRVANAARRTPAGH